MVLTPSSLLCVCRAKLLSAEWFHNSFFRLSLAYDCLELFNTVHIIVCNVLENPSKKDLDPDPILCLIWDLDPDPILALKKGSRS